MKNIIRSYFLKDPSGRPIVPQIAVQHGYIVLDVFHIVESRPPAHGPEYFYVALGERIFSQMASHETGNTRYQNPQVLPPLHLFTSTYIMPGTLSHFQGVSRAISLEMKSRGGYSRTRPDPDAMPEVVFILYHDTSTQHRLAGDVHPFAHGYIS